MTITVAMINYNNERYLRQAIESVLGQTRRPDELIISDDGSTDGSLAILEEYARTHSFLRILKTPRNLGAGGNRDHAIRHASSRFVINLDSDDWFEPTVIEKTLEAFARNPAAMVISSFRVVSESGDVLESIDTTPFCMGGVRRRTYLLASRKRCMPGNQFALDKGRYEQLGGLDSRLKLYEDWEFLLRACRSGMAWEHTGIEGFCYRKTGNGLSSAKQAKHMKFRLWVMARNLGSLRDLPVCLVGFAALFVTKGYKYLTCSASSIGYN